MWANSIVRNIFLAEDSRLFMKNFIGMILAMMILSACHFKLSPADENRDSLTVVVQRYDRLESRYLMTGDYSALQQMSTEYPIETRTLIEDMLQLGEVNEVAINARLLNFFQDTTLQAIITEAETQYAVMDDISESLSKAFRHLRVWIPELPIPEVYAQIGALNQSIIVGENKVGISLDKYLGTNYVAYHQFYDDHQAQTMTRQYIVPDCLVFYLLSQYPIPETQQERDMHMGRVMWVVNRALEKPFFKSDYVSNAAKYMRLHPHVSIADFLNGKQ